MGPGSVGCVTRRFQGAIISTQHLLSKQPITLTADPEEESGGEEDLENDERAKLDEEQLVWDKTVKDMMTMEINQRKDEGDMEGFERG